MACELCRKGMVALVRAQLLGSVLSNLLLVLGTAFFLGGPPDASADSLFIPEAFPGMRLMPGKVFHLFLWWSASGSKSKKQPWHGMLGYHVPCPLQVFETWDRSSIKTNRRGQMVPWGRPPSLGAPGRWHLEGLKMWCQNVVVIDCCRSFLPWHSASARSRDQNLLKGRPCYPSATISCEKIEKESYHQNSPDRGQSRKIWFSKFVGSGLKKI